jgi:phosphotriesterase-related protein
MIETVLGPIPADTLGATSMHEHLLADSTALHRPAREPLPPDARVTMKNLGFVRWNLLALKDNLLLDDPSLAVAELLVAGALGQRAVVDLTSWGLGPRYAELPAISRATGMHIAAGYGAYLGRTHPDWLGELDNAGLENHFRAALTERIPGCEFRAALLGIMGTNAPIDPAEERVLRAAARAAGPLGACVSVRLDPADRLGPKVLEILESEGLPPGQVIFGNVDEFMDLKYLADLAAAGATLEWCFGNEAYYHDRYKDATDAERLDVLCAVLIERPAWSVVLGCSVWTKSQLRAYGGMGYGHLMGRIVPALLSRGVPERWITELLVDRPAALLDRAIEERR